MAEIILDSFTIKGIKLDEMPAHLCIIAALVKRLGGDILLSNKEVNPSNFTGVMLSLSTNGSVIIKAE